MGTGCLLASSQAETETRPSCLAPAQMPRTAGASWSLGASLRQDSPAPGRCPEPEEGSPGGAALDQPD